VSSRWFDLVSGNATGTKASLARAGLGVLSVPFAAASGLRRWLYRGGVLRQRRAPIPVISVGNITAGGTGKTPLVEYVVKGLVLRGRRPGVVTRGYGAKRGRSGDEATMLRSNVGAVVGVIEDANRYRGCVRAAQEYSADVAVLDDGFQHLALDRDLDIVVLDATNAFGFGRLLPAGCLRERPEHVARAHVVVITRSDLVPDEDLCALRDELSVLAPEAFVVHAVYRTTVLEGLDGSTRAPESIRDVSMAAFCGIGNPYAFGMTLRRLGAELVLAKRFPDHHVFTQKELIAVFQEAASRGAELVVTTQKDAARIPREHWENTGGIPVYVVRGEFALLDREKDLWKLITMALRVAEQDQP
jgi:tetraacyldisaccharide 4'-kinase